MYGIPQNTFAMPQNLLAGLGPGQGIGVAQPLNPNGAMPMGQSNGFDSMVAMLSQMMSMLNAAMMQQQLQALASPSASFGGAGSGGPGVGEFLGGGGGAGRPSVGGGGGAGRPAVGGGGFSNVSDSVPTATSSDFGKVPAWGAALAKDAERHATGSGGLCFRYVRQALERAGVKGVGGASAYMAADQLAKNPKFREIKVAEKDLKRLPAGAVVVWDRGNGHQHGHIAIALGNGQEASDVKRAQTTGSYGTKFRVFLPK